MNARPHSEKTEPPDQRWNLFEVLYGVACILLCGGVASWGARRFGALICLAVLGATAMLCYVIWYKYGHVINRRRPKRF